MKFPETVEQVLALMKEVEDSRRVLRFFKTVPQYRGYRNPGTEQMMLLTVLRHNFAHELPSHYQPHEWIWVDMGWSVIYTEEWANRTEYDDHDPRDNDDEGLV